MRILCLDVGDKRIGIAVSDEDCTLATGLKYINRDTQSINGIKELISFYAIKKIVFGLPLRFDGSISSQTEKTLAFVDSLKKETEGVELIPWDERLSSKQAETILIEADLSRKKRKKFIDKLSAQIILQSYLDAHSEEPENSEI